MFVQSNDLFFSFDSEGIALFDENGNPVSGDITDRIMLWDAGTETDEEPGVGH
ncbi:spondin domain-containing protein [Fodinibius sp.]|uniref:spondin domain-containing protein n=1 Tax=Fodinibius sp. TaxID=1872440 RepID=UPI003A0FD6C3